MLTKQDQEFLERAITRNACVLFLGAGFAMDARNHSGGGLPSGASLAEALWNWLGYNSDHGPYDARTSPLDKIFDVARKKRGAKAVTTFLEEQLTVQSYPEWYRTVAYPYWFRIYSTNVDDLVERIYADSRTTRLDVINATLHRYRDRDQNLSKLQYIKLNGSLDAGLDHVSFGARQYGARAGEYDAWYDHFVRDYAVHATILVGTQVNEPGFWHALVSRQSRAGAATELRLRSFLVSPTISPVVVDSLSEFNVVPVQAYAKDFFEYLSNFVKPPSYETIIAHVNPAYARFREFFSGDKRDVEGVDALLSSLERVAPRDKPSGRRSLYLLGAMATWDDIALGLDAEREVTIQAQGRIEEAIENRSTPAIAVTGHRGCGKSTLLMRVAVNLAAAGHLVFHGSGEDMPDAHVLARGVDRLNQPMVIFIDDAEWILNSIDKYVSELAKVRTPPVFVVAVRANALYRIEERQVPHESIWIRELTDADIDSVIGVLRREKMLGIMTHKSDELIRGAFRIRAQKQLLVAMREVTTGREFDKIISLEFQDLTDPELRITYLCACLATAASASLTKEQLVAASDLPPARLLDSLNHELREMLVPGVGLGDRFVARHQVVAQTVVEKAPKTELATAYKRILSVLAHDMDPRARKGDGRRWFRLYKRLINHSDLYLLFEKNIEEARAIFDSLMRLLSNDSQFWLQYGSLELQYGELDFASTYIATAEGLNPDDWYIQNAKGHLLLALARAAGTVAEAVKLREDGEAILRYLIDAHGADNAYPWHTLISHVLDWLEIWERDTLKFRAELEGLRTMIAEALEQHPMDDSLKQLKKRVEKAYLATAQSERRSGLRSQT